MTIPSTNPPPWTRKWLIAAGVYNLVWGAAVIAFPNALFDFAGIEPPAYPQLWQCIGMIVGVYGIGYLAAASNSRVHWPIVLVGLLGKVFGPIGFAGALITGDLPPAFGVTILTNDLLWWAPFAMMLWDAAKSRAEPDADTPSLDEALNGLVDQSGRSLFEITSARPTLVVFLRHSGCTFCRETLADLSAQRAAIEHAGHTIVLVSMSSPSDLKDVADRYGLDDVALVSDPDRLAYRALELRRGTFAQLFGLKVFLRGFAATIKGHLVGRLDGDGFQMPGAFVIQGTEVLRSFRHQTAADRPEYAGFCTPETAPS